MNGLPRFAQFMEASFAVLIGVSQYEQKGLRPLACPAKDVEAVADALIEHDFLPGNIWKLCDERATRLGISRAFLEVATLARKIRREHPLQQIRLFVYYSGHGRICARSGGGDTTYLCTYETAAEDAHLPVTAMDGECLNTLVAGIAPDQELRLLDCCHAAGLVGAKGEGNDLMDSLMTSMSKARGRGIIYACERDQFAWECVDGRSSVFARALVEGIRSGAHDHHGVVHIASLAAYLYARVPALARAERGEEQRPLLDLTQIDGEMPVVFRAQAFARARQTIAAVERRIGEATLSERERSYCREILSRWPDPSNVEEGRRIAFLIETAALAEGLLEAGVRAWLAPSSVRLPWITAPVMGRPPKGYQLVSVEHKVGVRAVFFALRESDGAPCVVKTIEGGSAFEREHFEQEARLLARLRSAYLPRLLGYQPEDDTERAVIIMERAPGEDLEKVIARRGGERLPVRSIIDILRQTSEALEDLQMEGIIHRDLKPGNIVVHPLDEYRWGVKVVDLGIAKDIGETHGTHQLEWVGTRMWMAPEQTDRRPATAATDVYALGLLSYWLLVGEPYWEAECAQANGDPKPLFAALQRGVLEHASARARRRRGVELPPAFDAVFARAVSPRPERRYPNASDFFAELVVALSQPIGARPAPVGAPHEEAEAHTPVTGLAVDPPAASIPSVPRRRSHLGLIMASLLAGVGGLTATLTSISPLTPDRALAAHVPVIVVSSSEPRQPPPAEPKATALSSAEPRAMAPATAVHPRTSPVATAAHGSVPLDNRAPARSISAAHARVLACMTKLGDPGAYKLWVNADGAIFFKPIETTLMPGTRTCAGLTTVTPR